MLSSNVLPRKSTQFIFSKTCWLNILCNWTSRTGNTNTVWFVSGLIDLMYLFLCYPIYVMQLRIIWVNQRTLLHDEGNVMTNCYPFHDGLLTLMCKIHIDHVDHCSLCLIPIIFFISLTSALLLYHLLRIQWHRINLNFSFIFAFFSSSL